MAFSSKNLMLGIEAKWNAAAARDTYGPIYFEKGPRNTGVQFLTWEVEEVTHEEATQQQVDKIAYHLIAHATSELIATAMADAMAAVFDESLLTITGYTCYRNHRTGFDTEFDNGSWRALLRFEAWTQEN